VRRKPVGSKVKQNVGLKQNKSLLNEKKAIRKCLTANFRRRSLGEKKRTKTGFDLTPGRWRTRRDINKIRNTPFKEKKKGVDIPDWEAECEGEAEKYGLTAALHGE